MTNTNTTHTPINLAPGLDLMVRADLVDDHETQRLVEKCKELLDRANHIREITDMATTIAEAWDRAAQSEPDSDEPVEGLDFSNVPVLEAAGIILAHFETAAYELKVLLAVLPVVPDYRIINVRECVELETRKLYAGRFAPRGAVRS